MNDHYYLVLCYKNRDQQIPDYECVSTEKGFSDILSSLRSDYAYIVVEHFLSMKVMSIPKELE